VVAVTKRDASKTKAEKGQVFHPDQGQTTADILVTSGADSVGMNLQWGERLEHKRELQRVFESNWEHSTTVA